MKVILNQVVPKVGKKDQVVTVKDGFARNYLFPRKMAIIATKPQLKALDIRLARQQSHIDAQRGDAEKVAEKINGQTIRIEGKVAHEGTKLFGAITSQNICDLIQEKFGVTLDKKQIALLLPIKQLGHYKIQIDLHQKVDAFIDLDIYDPNAIVEAPAASATPAESAEPTTEVTA